MNIKRLKYISIKFILSDTHQLLCRYRCQMTQKHMVHSCQNLSIPDNCRQGYAKRCHGRIMLYFDEKDGDHITYSLGPTGHIIEQEIEDLAIQNYFKSVIYFLFLVESFRPQEWIVSVHIVCQTSDDCVWKYITDLFQLYCNVPYPVLRLNKLFNEKISLPLNCYDSETKQTKQCSIHYPTCIFNKTNIIEQHCSSESNPRLEYAFMITSSRKNRIEKQHELLICDRNHCNEESKLKQLELIVYNYTIAMSMPINNSNKLKFYFIYLFIFIIISKD